MVITKRLKNDIFKNETHRVRAFMNYSQASSVARYWDRRSVVLRASDSRCSYITSRKKNKFAALIAAKFSARKHSFIFILHHSVVSLLLTPKEILLQDATIGRKNHRVIKKKNLQKGIKKKAQIKGRRKSAERIFRHAFIAS